MRRYQKTSICIWLVLAVLASVTTQAQIVKGTFVGTVMDSSRAALPRATITVTNLSTTVAATTVADSAGNYNLPFLDAGV